MPNSSLRPSPSPRRASPPGRCSINAQLNGDGSLRRPSPGMTGRKQGGGRSGVTSEGLLGIQEGDCHTLWWRERCRQRLSTRVCQPQPLGTDKDVEEGEKVRAPFSPGPRMLGGTHGGARIVRDGAKSGVFAPISERLGPSISQTSPSPSGKWEDPLLHDTGMGRRAGRGSSEIAALQSAGIPAGSRRYAPAPAPVQPGPPPGAKRSPPPLSRCPALRSPPPDPASSGPWAAEALQAGPASSRSPSPLGVPRCPGGGRRGAPGSEEPGLASAGRAGT